MALWRNDAFWTTWYGWLLALVFYDFCYYWLHRAGHESAIFWAAHVVHHQSQDYNLSTALRQTSSGALLGWIFYVPMALAGVPPLVFGVVALVDLLYQFWVHTEHVPKLGWFDRWFCSPSNHRVHHAVNDGYLDRNYGGVLIVWDRMFGSFQEEDEPCVYGTRSPLNSWDPLWSNARGVLVAGAGRLACAQLARTSCGCGSSRPGWRPADVAARFPRPAFDIAQGAALPPADRAGGGVVRRHPVRRCCCAAWSLFLWHADSMPLPQSAVWLAALAVGLWCVGAVMQGRLDWLEVLLVEAAALATATSALGLIEWHLVFKPLAMLLAIAFVADPRHRRRHARHRSPRCCWRAWPARSPATSS